MKVSIVIPVYNVEKYLPKCLESVEKQTYEDLEVIVVNDGTKDNSQLIIDEYVNRNKNFYTYKIENRGLGGARNYGLEKATGDAICFLDSDDYLDVTFVEKMVHKMIETDSDIVICDNYDVIEDTNELIERKNVYGKEVTSLEESKDILFNRVSAWGKLYRMSLFEDEKMRYVSREWYEDMRLTPKLYLKARKIAYVYEPLIYYLIREGSIMNNSNAIRNLEIIDAFKDLIGFYKQKNAYELYKDELEFLMLDHTLVSAVTRVALTKDPKAKDIIRQLKEYVESFKNIYNNPYIETMPRNRRIVLFFNKNNLVFLTKLVFMVKG